MGDPEAIIGGVGRDAGVVAPAIAVGEGWADLERGGRAECGGG